MSLLESLTGQDSYITQSPAQHGDSSGKLHPQSSSLALQPTREVGGSQTSLFPAIVSANMTLRRGLRDLVSFRSFLRLLSFLYLLSLNEHPSRNTGFSWEVKATQHPHGMLRAKRFWKLSQGKPGRVPALSPHPPLGTTEAHLHG